MRLAPVDAGPHGARAARPSTGRPPAARPPVDPRRRLRRVGELPPRARAFLVLALLAIAGFAAWVTVRLLAADGRALAIVLIALSYIGALAVSVAVVTLTRLAFSLGALPYLLGRGARRLLGRRRR